MFGANYFGETFFGESFIDYFLDVSGSDSVQVFEGDTVVDQTLVSELVQASMPLPGLSINDSPTTSEFVSLHIPITANTFDATTVTDFPGFYPDLVIVTESLALLFFYLLSLSDNVTTSEVTLLQLFPAEFALFDTVTTTESVSIQIPKVFERLFDSTIVSESVHVSFPIDEGNLIQIDTLDS